MNADEFVNKVIKYGADKDGIRDRFGDNAELYETCFREFLNEPNFAKLDDAIKLKTYENAFGAAHALKGVSGNLGLYALYEAVCILVESLRDNRYDNIEEEYKAVREEHNRLIRTFSDDPELSETHVVESAESVLFRNLEVKIRDNSDNKTDENSSGNSKLIYVSVLFILAFILLVGFFFCRININYNKNILKETGEHLSKTANQIELYIEEHISNDWRIANSVADSIIEDNSQYDDEKIIGMMKRKQAVWEVSELMLYTESGYCIYSSGKVETNDKASNVVDKARENGRYMSVIDSKITYTIPLYTDLCYHGSKIAAVSVVRNMSSFLDDMKFSYYSEDAWMYLTGDNGVVISMLNNDSAVKTFNFKSFTDDSNVVSLDKAYTSGQLFDTGRASAFLVTSGSDDLYLVSVPIETGMLPLRLFYLEPETVVNNTTNGFSNRLLIFSIVMIVLFAVCAFTMFIFIYIHRKRSFDKAITVRDRMFDLLIQNTKTAFALFDVRQEKPIYISSNAADIIGDEYWTVVKSGNTYSIKNDSDSDTYAIRCANAMLAKWDGKSAFRSGYIRNNHATLTNYFEYQLYPVDDEGTEYVGIIQNVTSSYEREEATRNAMEMAKQSDEAKSRFLSNMSHDIRTPMNAIMNMTNFALESIDQPKKLAVYLRTIHESSEHLLHIINDVLDMSRIESGQTVIASEPFNIKTEIQRQVDMITPICTEKKLTLITNFTGIRTSSVCGDALKLSQIIMNLLSNAVKFTPSKGAIRFTAKEIPSLSDDIVDVRFVIEDTGIGISAENMEHIFDPFCRANDKKVNKIEGTGLGLSICKNYVNAMGGTIRCDSEEGGGSTFTVELFFPKADVKLKEGIDTYLLGDVPFAGMRCLVVEDNITNQLIAKEMLERLGFIVDFADDGAVGAEEFVKSQKDTYDIIYMDIQMPVLDGYQSSIAIRTSRHPRAKTVPIVAMTANAFAEDIEKARVSGMDAYIRKPIVSFELIEQTYKAINKKKE